MRKFLSRPVDSDLAIAVYILMIILGAIAVSAVSCKTPQQLQAERSARDEKTRQAEMVQLEQLRQKYPCAPAQVIQGKTVYLTGDSVPCPVQNKETGQIDTVYVKCPPRPVRVDTFKMIDYSMLQSCRDSLASANYAFDLAR